MYIGVDYYPEQWPESRWPEDVRLMKELGVNVVRLAEFGWQLMEPQEGKYDFSLYDRAIKLLTENGIKIVLGTPTATPPAWLIQKHPEILPTDENGVQISFGARRHYTVNSKVFREYTKKIVTEMASHYGQHPDIIGWQTDNEYGHEKSDRSYGEEDREAFQVWLQKKYGSLEQLNKEWGTVFWSQTYTDWAQIPVPRKVYQEHNPSMLLDFDRFCADAYTSYNRLQTDCLRANIRSGQFLTHNFVYTDQAINQWDMSEDLDYVAYDNYPVWGGLAEPVSPSAIAHQHDLCRGTKNGKGYWVMEELSGAQGWSKIGYLPRPGHIKLWTYQAISRGAEAIVYFRWRAAQFGTEEFCHGILDHDGIPKRKYNEVKEVISSLKVHGDDWIASKFEAQAGVYYDPENAWAWNIQPQSSAFSHRAELLRHYAPAHKLNVATDAVNSRSDLSAYKAVIVPIYFLESPEFTEKLKAYAQNGGTVVFSYRSGVKKPNNFVTGATLPGELTEMTGIRINEYESLQTGQSNSTAGTAGSLKGLESSAEVWCDLIEPVTAEVLAEYRNCFYEGTAAVTKNQYGKGTVYYIGTALEEELLTALYKEIFAEAGIETVETEEGVEAVRRGLFLSIMNHTVGRSASVTLPEGEWMDCASGQTVQKTLQLDALGAVLLKKSK
ncbi:cellulase family glycosylhydrolase [Bacillus mangrovi]|uniref:Beta-galactosidase n=1 Tax=Metabacillus mangrovi TaxID=1491830 RepID=A0A7X2V750_9BACI|nr:beta-galactosidase [Metabacillus mangrovi]MTH55603.1 cellulase family glycosylhydrolase [Metabacillus mangrovi]